MVKEMKRKEILVEECRTDPERSRKNNIILYEQDNVKDEEKKRELAYQRMAGILFVILGWLAFFVEWDITVPIGTTFLGLGCILTSIDDEVDSEN